MFIRITEKTRTRDVLPFLTAANMQQVLDRVAPVSLSRRLVEYTVGEFVALTRGEFPSEVLKERRAVRMLGKLRTLRDETENLQKYIKRLSVPMSASDKQAAIGVQFPTGEERMLVDLVKFFGLKSFEEAEKMTVASWLLVVKDTASSAKFERNRARLMQQRGKIKNGGKL